MKSQDFLIITVTLQLKYEYEVKKVFLFKRTHVCMRSLLTSIPSNLNFITGTNASSTALKGNQRESIIRNHPSNKTVKVAGRLKFTLRSLISSCCFNFSKKDWKKSLLSTWRGATHKASMSAPASRTDQKKSTTLSRFTTRDLMKHKNFTVPTHTPKRRENVKQSWKSVVQHFPTRKSVCFQTKLQERGRMGKC